MRTSILRGLYKLFPFDLHGDCLVPPGHDGIRISCIINFYGRLNVLEGILWSLAQQDFPRSAFEVILVEDRGGSEEGRSLAEEFSSRLPIVYAPLDKQYGLMGYSRNFGLEHSRGEFVLFLDDDTIILQDDFLKTMVAHFDAHPGVSAIMPHGEASFAFVDDRYDFHDPFFMTSRCTAYRREVLASLGGFMSTFIGQEDVEFVIRFHSAGNRCAAVPQLAYRHPPLYITNLGKPMAVGSSFYGIRKRYPLPMWLLAVINCSRHLPLVVAPSRKHREMGRFGLGFLWGVLTASFRSGGLNYR